eukprot:gene23195-30409_t
MGVLDWQSRYRYNAAKLEDDLNSLEKPANVRIDLRFNDLPISCLDVLKRFLCNDMSAAVCVGNNGFEFVAFNKELERMGALELFETDRITLGWTPQDIQTGQLAASALKEDRVMQLAEAMAAMQKEHSISFQRKETLRNRVLTLEGYNSNQDKSLEHAVTDEVDDHMQVQMHYKLEGREHRFRIWDSQGSEVGEVDGLLTYTAGPGCKGPSNVVVVVEVKSNMTDEEYEKIQRNIRTLQGAISAGPATAGATNIRRQQASLAQLQGHKLLVAICAPVVPRSVEAAAVQARQLVVQLARSDRYTISNRETWKAELDG